MLRTIRSFFLIVCLIAFSLNFALAGSKEDLKEANKLHCVGKHKEAIKLCTRIIKSEKEDKRILRKAYMQRAFNYGRLKKYDKAIDDMDMVVKMKPDRASSYSARARTYRQSGDIERAIADFNRSLELKENAGTFEDRGDCYAQKGDRKKAISDYERARELTVLKKSKEKMQEKIDALR